MASNFPAALDNGTSLPNPASSNPPNSPSHAGLHDNENAAIIATQTKVGTGASTPIANTFLFGTGTGTSAWTQATSAQVLAAVMDETGTGSLVFATTPTLVTPKVDTINESTPANGVTVGGVNLKSGAVSTAGAVGTSAIAAAAVTPAKLATGALGAFAATSEITTSATYVDLATTTDTVTVSIGTNGLAFVSIFGLMQNSTANALALIGFALSGANTQVASDILALRYQAYTGNTNGQYGASFLLTGLTAGSTVFKMKYRVDTGTGSFANRRIAVVPL